MSWSNGRANVFAIHSWDSADADACRRMEELLRQADPSLAHYTLTPERAVSGTAEQVLASIETRIDFATAVVVMNTPGLHKRETAGFEMDLAVRKRKRIVVVQPYREHDLPVSGVLRDQVYYLAPWRSDVVGRAIRGEYPPGQPVYDIAEAADRRRLVGWIAAAIVTVSALIVGATAGALSALRRDLAAQGVDLRLDAVAAVAGHALIGAGIGLLLGALSGDEETMLYTVGAGAAAGAAIGMRRVYHAKLTEARGMHLLTVTPS